MLLETPTSPFAGGVRKCAEKCDKDIHRRCFQRDGTRHVTMWSGKITHQQARGIRFGGKQWRPVGIELKDGWNGWTAGNYIKVSAGSVKMLKGVVKDLGGCRERETRPCFHVKEEEFEGGQGQGGVREG